jgi:two-component system response regulator
MKPILLVEDSQDDELLVIRTLKKNHIANEILVARDGAEALDYLFGQGTRLGHAPLDPQVVLLDLKLPKLSGLDVLREIRKDPRIRLVPVVVLTSSDEDGDVEESYRLGANSYVKKPVAFPEFSEAIRNVGLYWMVINRPA